MNVLSSSPEQAGPHGEPCFDTLLGATTGSPASAGLPDGSPDRPPEQTREILQDQLRIRLQETSTVPGLRTTVLVRLENPQDHDVRVRIQPVGLEDRWFTVLRLPVIVPARQEVVATIGITPPHGTVAGLYPWSLLVQVIGDDPTRSPRQHVHPMTLRVHGTPPVSITLRPRHVRLWLHNRFTAVLTNTATVPVPVRMGGEAGAPIRVRVPAQEVSVPRWQWECDRWCDRWLIAAARTATWSHRPSHRSSVPSDHSRRAAPVGGVPKHALSPDQLGPTTRSDGQTAHPTA